MHVKLISTDKILCHRKHGSIEEPLTAAQQSKAASIAADKVTEKDGGAVTERKHFPLNVNRLGYIVFSVSYPP